MNSGGFPYSNPTGYVVDPNTVLSDGGASAVDNFPKYDSISGVLISDSGYNYNSWMTPEQAAADYLPLIGGTLSGDLDTENIDMQNYDLSNVGLLNGVDADEIITASSVSSVIDDIPTFTNTGAKRLKTSGVGITSLLSKSGGTMTGPIDMGSQAITNLSSTITTWNSSVSLGLNNTITPSAGSIAIGSANTGAATSTNKSIIAGYANNTSGTTDGSSIIYGYGNVDSHASGGAFMFGFNNTNGTGQRNILIGRDNTVPNAVNEAFVIGWNNTNSTSNSLMVGGTSHANIRAGSTICDLGTTANPFKDLYLNGSFIGSGATDSSSTATGALRTAGGLAVVKNAYIGATLNANTVESTIGSRARSQYVNLTKAINNADVVVANTVVQTTLRSGSAVTYASSTTFTGILIRIKVGLEVTSFGGGGTLSLTAYVGVNQVYLGTWPAATAQQGVLTIDLCPRTSNFLRCQGLLVLQGGVDQIYATNTAVWDPAVSNVVDIRAQWSVASASNSVTAYMLSVESLNQA